MFKIILILSFVMGVSAFADTASFYKNRYGVTSPKKIMVNYKGKYVGKKGPKLVGLKNAKVYNWKVREVETTDGHFITRHEPLVL